MANEYVTLADADKGWGGNVVAWRKNYWRDELNRLQKITNGCRNDMHEPDEQDVSATFEDGILDNAGSGGELTLVIAKGDKVERFNVANLIALARSAGTQIDWLV